MYFCDSCEMVMDSPGKCPRCGAKEMRPIRDNDPIFITRMPFAWSGTLADIMREEGIPFRTRSVLGTYLAYYFGRVRDDDEFYVCFGDYDKAMLLVELLKSAMADAEVAEGFEADFADNADGGDEEIVDPTPEQERRRPFGF